MSTGDGDSKVQPSVTELVLGKARIASGVVLVDWIDLQRITSELVSAHCMSNLVYITDYFAYTPCALETHLKNEFY